MRLPVTILGLLILLAVPAYAGGWYYTVEPPGGGNPIVVGPYNSLLGCRDWLGSAIYAHGPFCHNHPSAANCTPTGLGYAAPGEPSSDCESATNGWGFFWYPANGGGRVIESATRSQCERLRLRYDAGEFGAGDLGAGCFFSGNTHE